MLKNKEDNFLGDNITHNIKYGDNEWQAHGTIDREPAYTKESILNLIFEEYQYNAEKGEYNYGDQREPECWMKCPCCKNTAHEVTAQSEIQLLMDKEKENNNAHQILHYPPGVR